MQKTKLISLLGDHKKESVEQFVSYCEKLETEKNTQGQLKNPWFKFKTDETLAEIFKKINSLGLVFDGEHITLQANGISFDYVAYKNRMLIAYPESTIDLQLVYEGDVFSFEKNSGKVTYDHKISDPFKQKEELIIGGYCVIKNKRGEFLTTLSKEDFTKHRKVAKTDFIWAKWFKEMAMKTLIKKAVKYHFNDIYSEIEAEDNVNYDLENPIDLDLEFKQEIEKIETIEDLKTYYEKNKGQGKGFDKLVMDRKTYLLSLTKKTDENS